MSNEHAGEGGPPPDESIFFRDIRPVRRPARVPEAEPVSRSKLVKSNPPRRLARPPARPDYLRFSDAAERARGEESKPASDKTPASSELGTTKPWWRRDEVLARRTSSPRTKRREQTKAEPARGPRLTNARQVALQVLQEWERVQTYAEELIEQTLARVTLGHASDRALINALVLGVLRNKTMLDIWIDELNQREHLAPAVRWILRLGLFQLFKLKIPPHAAVAETVELAQQERRFVNAVLREALREKEHLLAVEEAAAAHEKYSLPDFLVARWRWLFGAEGATRLMELTAQPAETFVRLNRLRPWAEPPPGAEPVEGVPDFFRVTELPHAALKAGHCYAQDPATWFAPALLRPQPDQTVLDACAAPGGKTAILAQLMENQGTLVATDINPQRLRRLKANLQRLGVTCAQVEEVNWGAPEVPDDGRRYDRILLDVPCSNTGVMRRRVDVRWRVSPAVIAEMADLQARILRQTLLRLKPNGLLCYSTCSLEPAENDRQIERLLEEFPRFTLLEKKLITPHETGFDGAFIAVLRAPSA